MSRDELLELAERVEQAKGPDRELDVLIAPWAGWVEVQHNHPSVRSCIEPDGTKHPHGLIAWAPKFTASLDAAMSLVPEGCVEWHCGRHMKTGQGQAYLLNPKTMREPIYRLAATPALALTAACLRARAALEGGPGHGGRDIG